MLMIGEGRGEFGKAVEGESGVDGEGGGKEGVEEEIERLEDEVRIYLFAFMFLFGNILIQVGPRSGRRIERG